MATTFTTNGREARAKGNAAPPHPFMRHLAEALEEFRAKYPQETLVEAGPRGEDVTVTDEDARRIWRDARELED